jgi:hypothetical protein
MERLRQAGIDVPSRMALDAPPEPAPDGRYDDEFGIGPATGKVDPWKFEYNDD